MKERQLIEIRNINIKLEEALNFYKKLSSEENDAYKNLKNLEKTGTEIFWLAFNAGYSKRVKEEIKKKLLEISKELF